MIDPIIGYSIFADGSKRPVLEQLDGVQYVLDDDGERVYAIWFITEPGEEIDLPIVVTI